MDRQALIVRVRERAQPTLEAYALLFDRMLAVMTDDQLDQLAASYMSREEIAVDLVRDLWSFINDSEPRLSMFGLRARMRRLLESKA